MERYKVSPGTALPPTAVNDSTAASWGCHSFTQPTMWSKFDTQRGVSHPLTCRLPEMTLFCLTSIPTSVMVVSSQRQAQSCFRQCLALAGHLATWFVTLLTATSTVTQHVLHLHQFTVVAFKYTEVIKGYMRSIDGNRCWYQDSLAHFTVCIEWIGVSMASTSTHCTFCLEYAFKLWVFHFL